MNKAFVLLSLAFFFLAAGTASAAPRPSDGREIGIIIVPPPPPPPPPGSGGSGEPWDPRGR